MRVSKSGSAVIGASFASLALMVLAVSCTPSSPQVTVYPTLPAPVVPTGMPTVDQTNPLARGQVAYNTYCAHCHGYSGEGEKASIDPSKPDKIGYMPVPRHDSEGHTWMHPDQLIKDAVRNGIANPMYRYAMPAVPEDRLSDQQIGDILGYVKQWWTEDQRATQAQYTEAMKQARESLK